MKSINVYWKMKEVNNGHVSSIRSHLYNLSDCKFM